MIKSTDQYNLTLLLRAWAITFGFIGFPTAMFMGFSIYLLYAALAALLIAALILLIVSTIGNSFGNVFYGTGDKSNSGNPFAGDLDKAKHYLRQKEMVKVKQVIDEILEKDPNCTEALLIKAQALISLENREQAKLTLRKILQLCTNDDPNRKWASTLLDELTQ